MGFFQGGSQRALGAHLGQGIGSLTMVNTTCVVRGFFFSILARHRICSS
jgi:hypothetical protein